MNHIIYEVVMPLFKKPITKLCSKCMVKPCRCKVDGCRQCGVDHPDYCECRVKK